MKVAGLLGGADGRGQLTGAAGRMVLLGALRPAYNWLYHLRSGPVLERFRTLHDPDGFAALDPICDATPRFTVLDRRSAYHQLARILMHNGGRLADITLADCIEAYRAQDRLQRSAAQPLVSAAAPGRDPARRRSAHHLGGVAARAS